MYVKVDQFHIGGYEPVVISCPKCGNSATFNSIPEAEDLEIHDTQRWNRLGLRFCPNPACHALVFFWKPHEGRLVTFPSLRIDFKTENIPERIRSCLEEAITCQAEDCYIASTIMVRRTLEELCEDKASKGDNLKKRIEGLKSAVVLPQGLFEALDELRLLGNDASHIESKEYDQIGKDEVAVAIELTKEILKSVYQMDTLVEKLRKLKKN